MVDFNLRREYYELSDDLECKVDFLELTEKTKSVSEWAADKMGFKGKEKEHYMRANISNVVRENEVAKMISRIERDLFEANVDVSREDIVEKLTHSGS